MSLRRSLALFFVALFAASVWHVSAYAQPVSPAPSADESEESAGHSEQRVEWNPEWTRVSEGSFVAAGMFAAAALTARVVGPSDDDPWQAQNEFDEGARDALRLDGELVRRGVRDASDVSLALLVAYPVLIDAILMAAYNHESPDVAMQMALIALESMAIAAGIWNSVGALASRERPYGRECGGELPADNIDCTGSDRYLSFFSGHATLTFTAAVTMCVQNAHVPLHDGLMSHLPCAIGLTLAAGTATLRVLADQHYLSDVLTGAAVGSAVGFIVPTLLHYANPFHDGDRAPEGFEMTFYGSPGGVGVAGTF